MCTEYIDSVHSIGDENDLQLRTNCLLTATRILFEMIFVRGVVHGDFHPGNILIDSGGRLVILDYGLAFRLTAAERGNLARFFLSIVTSNSALAVDVMVASARYVPSILNLENVQRDVESLLDKASGTNAGTFRLSSFAGELFSIQSRHGLISTTEFTLPILALLTLEGSLKRWHPSVDFQREALPFVIQAL